MAEPYAWAEVCDDGSPAWAPRDGAGGLVFAGRMWMLGGWNWSDSVHFPRHSNSEVWASSNGQDWELVVKQAPWEGRHCAGYVVHAGKMWVVGGDANQGHYQTDCWSSENGSDWECTCAAVPWSESANNGRIAHITIAHAGAIFVIGGQNFPNWKSSFGMVRSLPRRGSWQLLYRVTPHKFMHRPRCRFLQHLNAIFRTSGAAPMANTGSRLRQTARGRPEATCATLARPCSTDACG